MPAALSARPVGAKSNSRKRAPVASARNAEISRFGGVPIRVVMPPSRVANDSGISSRPGA